jgi:hypothetical protein
MAHQTKNNISFLLHEEEDIQEEETNFDMNFFLEQIEKNEFQEDLMVPNIIHYHENFTIKELLLICDYYGISKEIKLNKCKKDIIIQILVDFETNYENRDIVSKRQNLWFYINELKNDKFMKKYILF